MCSKDFIHFSWQQSSLFSLLDVSDFIDHPLLCFLFLSSYFLHSILCIECHCFTIIKYPYDHLQLFYDSIFSRVLLCCVFREIDYYCIGWEVRRFCIGQQHMLISPRLVPRDSFVMFCLNWMWNLYFNLSLVSNFAYCFSFVFGISADWEKQQHPRKCIQKYWFLHVLLVSNSFSFSFLPTLSIGYETKYIFMNQQEVGFGVVYIEIIDFFS